MVGVRFLWGGEITSILLFFDFLKGPREQCPSPKNMLFTTAPDHSFVECHGPTQVFSKEKLSRICHFPNSTLFNAEKIQISLLLQYRLFGTHSQAASICGDLFGPDSGAVLPEPDELLFLRLFHDKVKRTGTPGDGGASMEVWPKDTFWLRRKARRGKEGQASWVFERLLLLFLFLLLLLLLPPPLLFCCCSCCIHYFEEYNCSYCLTIDNSRSSAAFSTPRRTHTA